MIWEIWDVVDVGSGLLSPFSKIKEYNDFTLAFCEFKNLNENGNYILKPKEIKKTYIYESPDNGKTVYRREFLSNKREII
jgi:hypothetical protein